MFDEELWIDTNLNQTRLNKSKIRLFKQKYWNSPLNSSTRLVKHGKCLPYNPIYLSTGTAHWITPTRIVKHYECVPYNPTYLSTGTAHWIPLTRIVKHVECPPYNPTFLSTGTAH
jgi:hypothetical protein